MATIIGGIYRGIPPVSMGLYVVSLAASFWLLRRRCGRTALAIGTIALTGIQLLAYAIGAAAGILPR